MHQTKLLTAVFVSSMLLVSGCSSDPVTPAESNPTPSMHVVTQWVTPGSARDIHVASGIAYVADNEFGVTVWDNLFARPNLIDTISTWGPASRVYYAPASNLLGIVTGYPKALLNLYDNNVQRPMGQVGSSPFGGADFFQFAPDTILLAHVEQDNDGFSIGKYYWDPIFYYWSDEPRSYHYSNGQPLNDVKIDYPNIYIAAGERGLMTLHLDGTNFGPGYSFNPIGSCDLTGNCVSISLNRPHNRVILASQYSGIQIVDVVDPANPVLISAYLPPETDDIFMALAVGDTVYALDRSHNVLAIDISDPTDLQTIWSYNSPAPSRLFFDESENTLYLADEQRGIVGFRW